MTTNDTEVTKIRALVRATVCFDRVLKCVLSTPLQCCFVLFMLHYLHLSEYPIYVNRIKIIRWRTSHSSKDYPISNKDTQ